MDRPLILHIITGLKRSGAEHVLFRLVKSLTHFRHVVVCLSQPQPNDLTDALRMHGIDVFHMNIHPRQPWSLINGYSICTLIRRLKPGVVQTWMYHADVIGGLMAMFSTTKPIVWNIRNGTFSTPMQLSKKVPFITKLAAFLSRFIPHTILSCSQNAIEFHHSIGYAPRYFVHIPNGIDCQRFDISAEKRFAFRQMINIPDGVPCVGLVARWHPQKDIPTFLKACHTVLQQNHNVRFVLVGHDLDGANTELCHLVQTYEGLADALTLLGSYNDIPTVMNGLDVLCMTSAFGEGFPNVIGEAMACGRPCVATNVGDAAVIIGDYGSVCSIGDVDSIAEAIKALIHNPLDSIVVRQHICDHYTLDHMTMAYQRFYTNLIDGKCL